MKNENHENLGEITGLCRLISENYADIQRDLVEVEQLFKEDENFDQINLLLDELEKKQKFLLGSGLFDEFIARKLAKESGVEFNDLLDIKAELLLGYNNSIETMKSFKLSTGGKVISADMDGREFLLPEFDEIFRKLKPKQVRAFLKMKELEMMPVFQVTPIAYSLSVLIDNLRDKKSDFKGQNGLPLIEEVRRMELDETKLRYGINAVSLTDRSAGIANVNITFGGTLKKKQWVENNKAFLLEIVATKPWVDASVVDQLDELNAAQFVEISLKKFKEFGFTARSLESYVVMLMNEIVLGSGKNIDTLAFLPESNNDQSPEYINACFYTSGKGVGLTQYSAQSGRETMWLPPAIRLEF